MSQKQVKLRLLGAIRIRSPSNTRPSSQGLSPVTTPLPRKKTNLATAPEDTRAVHCRHAAHARTCMAGVGSASGGRPGGGGGGARSTASHCDSASGCGSRTNGWACVVDDRGKQPWHSSKRGAQRTQRCSGPLTGAMRQPAHMVPLWPRAARLRSFLSMSRSSVSTPLPQSSRQNGHATCRSTSVVAVRRGWVSAEGVGVCSCGRAWGRELSSHVCCCTHPHGSPRGAVRWARVHNTQVSSPSAPCRGGSPPARVRRT